MEPLKNNKLQELLPRMVTFLILLQPLLDILSFWTDRLGMSNGITLGLRFLMLAGFGLFGFCISNRKKSYLLLAAVYLILLIGHVYACTLQGYREPVYDLTNFVRVAQMPLFAFCFITCLRRNRRCYRAIELGLIYSFWIITAALVLGVLTGTAAPTYEESGYGLVGWVTFGNSQSAILSILVPVVITLAYRQRNLPVFCLTVLAGFGQLYLLGTRLAYFSIFVTAAGIILVALLTKSIARKYLVILMAAAALCAAGIKVSPMYLNQHQYEMAMASKQSDANVMIQNAVGTKKNNKKPTEADARKGLQFVYRFYSSRMCMRFGADRVIEKYDRTSVVSEITATRRQKIMFCKLLMDEHPPISRVFGMELSRMQFHNYIYDVENDFHGIFFLFGGAGLFFMAAFLAYFIFLVLKALFTDFRKYFTVEAGAFGIAFCLTLVNAYATAGVLRRPNASFYMSVLLAVIYYLVTLRVYPPKQPEKKEKTA